MSNNLPNVATPAIDVKSGLFTTIWLRYFQSLALTISQLSGQTLPPATIVVSSSPFNYTAPSAGYVLISGPGVTSVAIKRGVAGYVSTGRWYGSFPVAAGDILRITYFSAPTVTFFSG